MQNLRFGTVIHIRMNAGSGEKGKQLTTAVAQAIASRLPGHIPSSFESGGYYGYLYTNTAEHQHQNRFLELQAIKGVMDDESFQKHHNIRVESGGPKSYGDALYDLHNGRYEPVVNVSFNQVV
jgi:hypothetical protein